METLPLVEDYQVGAQWSAHHPHHQADHSQWHAVLEMQAPPAELGRFAVETGFTAPNGAAARSEREGLLEDLEDFPSDEGVESEEENEEGEPEFAAEDPLSGSQSPVEQESQDGAEGR